MAISTFITPYPDFKNNEIINPDQFDANSLALQNKLNEMVALLNSITNPTWANITLNSGFTVFSGRTPRYAKIGGEVSVEGEIVATSAGLITTLPTGFRPPALRSFKVSQNWSASNDGATIYVNTDGTVTLQVAGSYAQSISLCGIRFSLT